MEKVICPYCEKDLAENLMDNISKEEYSIARYNNAGSVSVIPDGIMFYALITCPNCNKILGAVNGSPIPVPGGYSPFKRDKH